MKLFKINWDLYPVTYLIQERNVAHKNNYCVSSVKFSIFKRYKVLNDLTSKVVFYPSKV